MGSVKVPLLKCALLVARPTASGSTSRRQAFVPALGQSGAWAQRGARPGDRLRAHFEQFLEMDCCRDVERKLNAVNYVLGAPWFKFQICHHVWRRQPLDGVYRFHSSLFLHPFMKFDLFFSTPNWVPWTFHPWIEGLIAVWIYNCWRMLKHEGWTGSFGNWHFTRIGIIYDFLTLTSKRDLSSSIGWGW